jgi:hypothetical protein
VDGDEDEAVGEDVNVLGPVLHRGVAAVDQLSVEVGVHGMDLQCQCFSSSSLQRSSRC